jgi:uncharacterized membrane protein
MIESFAYTFLWSISPIFELRAAIPLGYLHFGLTIQQTFFIALFGNFLAGAIILALLPKIVLFIENYIPIFHTFMNWVFHHTRKKHSHKVEIMGEIVLIFFVAIPLPGSGAWTGALVSYLFGIKYWKAIMLIFIGLTISGISVALLTLSGKEIWDFFIEVFLVE